MYKKRWERFIKNCCVSLHRTTVTSVAAVRLSRQSIAYPRIATQYVCASSRGATLDVWLRHTWIIKRGVAKTLGKVYQQILRNFYQKPLRKVYQTRGMPSIPQHRVKRGVAL